MLLSAKQTLKKQAGLGLIESLIALLVISIGLLGIAALQITSMQNTSSAHWHSQAVWYSYEMTDRIRANTLDPTNPVNFNSYNGIDTATDYDMDCQTNACTAAEMVTADAEDWKNMLDNLPGGRGIISSPGTNILQVSVMWQDNSAQSNCINGEPVSGDFSCYTVTITP